MNTPYFDSLIDDFGIWQHTRHRRVLRRHGYALDDAARGLIACLALGRQAQAEVLLQYLEKSYKAGHLFGFAHADRTYFVYPASDDATGQTLWALGYAYHLGFHPRRCLELTERLKPALQAMTYVRGPVYALLGALYVDQQSAKQLLAKIHKFFAGATDDWPWPEPSVTYANGILPYAFLRYALVTGDQTAHDFGRRLLEFVQTKSETGRPLGPIGNEGWLTKTTNVAPNYSQQPIDTAYMVWAWLAAYELSHEPNDLAQARRWWQWFEGHNIANARMYDQKSLAAYDGIDRVGVHHDSGAESNICLLLTIKLLETQQTV